MHYIQLQRLSQMLKIYNKIQNFKMKFKLNLDDDGATPCAKFQKAASNLS